MKFTKRSDGEMRASTVVEFTVDRQDLVVEVAWMLNLMEDHDSLLPPDDGAERLLRKSNPNLRRAIERRLLTKIKQRGEALQQGRSIPTDRYMKKADELIDYLYPELTRPSIPKETK